MEWGLPFQQDQRMMYGGLVIAPVYSGNLRRRRAVIATNQMNRRIRSKVVPSTALIMKFITPKI